MFKGSLVAIITPFTKENKVDVKALKKLVNFHIENKTDGIVCCGTTGESPSLTEKEKLLVIKTCVKEARKKIPIIAGTGCYNTKESFNRSCKAKKLKVDGLLIIVPYYNKPMEEGIFYHFEKIAKIGLPIILYHHPGRCGVKISLKGFQKLSEIKNIVGIKDCSLDLNFVQHLKEKTRFDILAGDDSFTLNMMKKGAIGSVSVIANIIPGDWKKMIDLFFSKNFKKAEMLYQKYEALIKAISLETNPQCIKYAMSLFNKEIFAKLRLPLIGPKERVKEIIRKEIKKVL